ncbi:hypothetical protein [Phytomonospora endophytica]|uniref:Uncharacterized protein n=1 Tax=Phytomonospora endophytica TaxID=714109 RepID=A0A841FTD6_9ACTN|nr:hypothetical protein [Phytomonospora endophytica]MBB6039575.1 hypothetical protein [Phytomonospora endophytica]GIG70541.1 hypothetical protein Pen01_68360 [Phytomonospora endophytica]
MPDGLRFAPLGPLRAWRQTRELDLGRPQQRSLLALMEPARPDPLVPDPVAQTVPFTRAEFAEETLLRMATAWSTDPS